MRREPVMEVLRQHWIEIRERYGVESLDLFGSVSRDEAQQQSDVDLLVKLVHPPGFDGYIDLKFYLEQILNCRVDLVMEGA